MDKNNVLTDEQRQAMWNEACQDTPQNPGWRRHLRYANAIERATIAALAQAQGAEPVAWRIFRSGRWCFGYSPSRCLCEKDPWQPLFTAPPDYEAMKAELECAQAELALQRKLYEGCKTVRDALAAEVERLSTLKDALLHALEIIAVGDAGINAQSHASDALVETGLWTAQPQEAGQARELPEAEAIAKFEAWATKEGTYDLRPAKVKMLSVGGEPYDGYVRPYLQDRTVYTYQGFLAGLAAQASPAVPEVLFDGYTVLQALDDRARARISAENVSDVLDAVVRLIRSAPSAPQQKEGDK